MSNVAYLDTCVFIEMLQKSKPERLDACQDLIAKAKKGELIIVTSVASIVEVHRITDGKDKLPPDVAEAESQQVLGFFENEYINVRQIDREIAECAHKLTISKGFVT